MFDIFSFMSYHSNRVVGLEVVIAVLERTS